MSYGVPSSSSSTLAAEPKHKGTLACVVLKAKNLPNKRSIGKQDPFAVLTIGQDKQKTKPDKRGGQHPQWDEQLHFEIYDDAEEVVHTSSSSSTNSAVRKAGKKVLKVACYADDNKEPDFIGDGLVDLTDVLKSGEFDEWVTIRHKDRYCGEVYLELTFFSAAPRPKKVVKNARPTMDSIAGGAAYGGAGTFSSDLGNDFAPSRLESHHRNAHPSLPPTMRPGRHSVGLSTSSSNLSGNHRQTYVDESSAPGMRPSQSLAGMAATYTPPYAPAAAFQHRPLSPQPPPLPPQGYHGHQRLSSSATMPAIDNRRRHSAVASDNGGFVAPYAAGPSAVPSSYSQSFTAHGAIPASHSSATIRPGSTQTSVEDALNDLIRPMSSMSVGSSRPMPPPTPTTVYQPGDYRFDPSAPPASQSPSQPQWEQQQDSQRHHHQRPSSIRTPSHSYSGPSPTPPPPSHSAPPQMPYPQNVQTPSYVQYPPARGDSYQYSQQQVSSQQVHPAQTFVPATLAHSLNHPAAPTQFNQHRPTSPALPPLRPVSSSSYHALPPVPSQTSPAGYRASSQQNEPHHQGQAAPYHHQQPPSQHQPHFEHFHHDRAPSPASYHPSSSYFAPQQPGAYVEQSPPHLTGPQTYRPQAQYSRSPSPSKSSRPLPPPSAMPPSGCSSTGPQSGYHQQDTQYQHGPPHSTSSEYGGYAQAQVPQSGGPPHAGYYGGDIGAQGSGSSREYMLESRHQHPPYPPRQEQSHSYSYTAPSPYDRARSPNSTGPPPQPYHRPESQQQPGYHEQRPRSPQPQRPHSSQGGGYTSAAAPASQLINSQPSGPMHAQQQQQSYYR